ncbi:MAG TPA: glycosyltransferase family 39 protein [Humisphaera sp.]|nr:glycosyltransferase family 39 protein [Humisphaera sp.]
MTKHRAVERKTAITAVHIAVIALAAFGGLIWVWLGTGRGIGFERWVIILTAAVVGFLPPIARGIERLLAPLSRPSQRSLNWTTFVIGVLSAAYFVSTAFNQGRDLFPKTHDDCSYAIGMQILARGRLWMPALPLPDFFDSFYILVHPVYCSLYFPGTALLYVPTVWLHLPTWLMPAMASGTAVALMYRITTELLDGACGILAAISMVSLSWFRVYSILLTGHVPMLLWGLVMIWAWLQWRKNHRLRWAALIGAAAGWAAITRPADATIFAVAVGVAIAYALFKSAKTAPDFPAPSPGTPGEGWGEGLSRNDEDLHERRDAETPREEGREKRERNLVSSLSSPRLGVSAFNKSSSTTPNRFLTPLVIIAAAAPFLVLQIVFDQGVTGHPFRAPYGYYLERDQPGSGFGFHHYNPAALPQSTLLEKREFYVNWARPKLAEHTAGNLLALLTRSVKMTVDTTMQCRLLLIFAAIGLLGLVRFGSNPDGISPSSSAISGRRVVWTTLPLFVIVYAFNPFFLEHYAILVIPAVVLSIMLGGQMLAAAWPRWKTQLWGAFVAIIVAASVTSLWEVNRLISSPDTAISDETFPSPYLKVVNDLPSYGVTAPAVVLFAYHPGGNYFAEPVYNMDVAWPDDAPIIRAHDLGPIRNREIFEYYAKIQPDRTFWSLDPFRKNEELKKLGTASELAAETASR